MSPTFPQREAKEAQLVHLPRHVLAELVNDDGGEPWHKEVGFFFSWGSRGGGSLRSPAVTGGWGSQLCFSCEHHRFTSGILGGKGHRKLISNEHSRRPTAPTN